MFCESFKVVFVCLRASSRGTCSIPWCSNSIDHSYLQIACVRVKFTTWHRDFVPALMFSFIKYGSYLTTQASVTPLVAVLP